MGNDPLNRSDPTGLCDPDQVKCPHIFVDAPRPVEPSFTSSMTDSSNNTQSQPDSASGLTPQNAGLLDDASEVVDQIKENWKLGRRGEAKARQILRQEGYTILGEQVYVKTKLGLRITDFVTSKNGAIYGWEAKTGFFAQRSSMQTLKDNAIASEGGVIISRGALGGGLTYGSSVHYDTGVISILDLGDL